MGGWQWPALGSEGGEKKKREKEGFRGGKYPLENFKSQSSSLTRPKCIRDIQNLDKFSPCALPYI